MPCTCITAAHLPPTPSYIPQEEQGEAAYNKVFQDALFKPLLLKSRAKMEAVRTPTSTHVAHSICPS